MKVRVKNVVDWRLACVAVSVNMLLPHLNTIFSRRKGVLSYLEPVHSPGCMRKKYVAMTMLYYSRRTGWPEAVTMFEICRRT